MKTKDVMLLLNTIIAAESAVLLAVTGFWGVSGGKLAVISTVVVVSMWSALGDLEVAVIAMGKMKNAEKRERKNAEAIVRGIANDEAELQKSGAGHRHIRMHVKKVRTGS